VIAKVEDVQDVRQRIIVNFGTETIHDFWFFLNWEDSMSVTNQTIAEERTSRRLVPVLWEWTDLWKFSLRFYNICLHVLILNVLRWTSTTFQCDCWARTLSNYNVCVRYGHHLWEVIVGFDNKISIFTQRTVSSKSYDWQIVPVIAIVCIGCSLSFNVYMLIVYRN